MYAAQSTDPRRVRFHAFQSTDPRIMHRHAIQSTEQRAAAYVYQSIGHRISKESGTIDQAQ